MGYYDPMTGGWLVYRRHEDGRTEWLVMELLGDAHWTEEKSGARVFHSESHASEAIAKLPGVPGLGKEKAA